MPSRRRGLLRCRTMEVRGRDRRLLEVRRRRVALLVPRTSHGRRAMLSWTIRRLRTRGRAVGVLAVLLLVRSLLLLLLLGRRLRRLWMRIERTKRWVLRPPGVLSIKNVVRRVLSALERHVGGAFVEM